MLAKCAKISHSRTLTAHFLHNSLYFTAATPGLVHPPARPLVLLTLTAQEMDSNQKTSRKSNSAIFPAKRWCHSNRPRGRGQFAHTSGGSGDLFMSSLLNLMGADGAFAADICVDSSCFIFSSHWLFIYSTFIYLMFASSFFDSVDTWIDLKSPVWLCYFQNCMIRKNQNNSTSTQSFIFALST